MLFAGSTRADFSRPGPLSIETTAAAAGSMAGMGTDLKEKLWNLGGGGGGGGGSRGVPDPPSPRKFPHQKIKIYAIRGHFYGNQFSNIHTTTNWNHLSDDHVKAPTLQMTDRHPKHHLTPVRTPLRPRTGKSWNSVADAFQA